MSKLTIIPATPGYYAVRKFPEGELEELWHVPVVAWQLNAEGRAQPIYPEWSPREGGYLGVVNEESDDATIYQSDMVGGYNPLWNVGGRTAH